MSAHIGLYDRQVRFVSPTVQIEVVPAGAALVQLAETLPVGQVFLVDNAIIVAIARAGDFAGLQFLERGAERLVGLRLLLGKLGVQQQDDTPSGPAAPSGPYQVPPWSAHTPCWGNSCTHML
ncbi:hypothetical protein EV688_11670 [Chromatocurvus halotolerans]|uniref:Uncharacterized protein n=1 Tax=Chromatocurvus halotolerans TaxID=1132028 RepID=A0A4R2KJ25_9GAMM|nr:hypothetical protein EV688_11670 [Chromatocurvus halotolerans]